jgi:hypothetical protein
MRRFIVMASLLVLSACGGQPAVEEAPAEGAPVTEEAGATGATSLTCTGNSWECFCAQYKTYDTCRAQRSCVWAYNKCSPTYE